MGFAKRPSLLRRRSSSNSTANAHTGIPEVLENMVGIKTLTIGYTKDIELAETRARVTGVRRLSIQTCPEGHSLNLNEEKRAKWLNQGWRLEGKAAYKTLVMVVMEGQRKARRFWNSKKVYEKDGAARIVV